MKARLLAAEGVADEDLVDVEPVGELTLKGFARPVATFSVRGLR